MKILYVCHAYPPHESGVGSFVQEVARGLVARGHQVWVVEPYHFTHGAPKGPRVDKGVQVVTWGDGYWPYRLFRRKDALGKALLWLAYKTKVYFLFFLWASYRCSKFIARFAAERQIDIVEVADGNENGALAATPFLPSKLVVRIHGSVHLQENAGVHAHRPLERMVYKKLERGLMKKADAFVGVSHYVAREAERIFSLTAPVPVIYNLAERPPDLAPLHTDDSVVFVGRIGKDKGADTLGKAWNIVAKKVPGFKLVVIGAGNAPLITHGVDEYLRGTVEVKTAVPKSEVFRHLAGAKCFVLPSRYESFGIALLEALLAGCAVVFTKRCCGPELIEDGVDGLLIDPDNPAELAAAMIKILTDDHYRLRLQAGAVRKAERFSNATALLDQNESFYRSILDARHG